LHGGTVGFDKRLWYVEAASKTSLTLKLESHDGEEGYPGALVAKVTYSLPDSATLKMQYQASSDHLTPCNLTNHTYWNLKDGGATPIVDHMFEMPADFYTPVDDTSIPTGEIKAVSGAMDLRLFQSIKDHGIGNADQGMGYDHNWCLQTASDVDGLRRVARVYEPRTGRWMAVRTDQPGVQFYTGNYLDGIVGRGGTKYDKHHGFCLETQHFPDSVNRSHFPTILLKKGQAYTHTTVHNFGCSTTPPTGAW
jgi:aldose 1-epimerase